MKFKVATFLWWLQKIRKCQELNKDKSGADISQAKGKVSSSLILLPPHCPEGSCSAVLEEKGCFTPSELVNLS